MIVQTEHGEVVISTDPRKEGARLQVCACRGSLGIKLTKDEAMKVSKALWYAVNGVRLPVD